MCLHAVECLLDEFTCRSVGVDGAGTGSDIRGCLLGERDGSRMFDRVEFRFPLVDRGADHV